VTLQATQTKSAMGNRGTFDLKDPDITKAKNLSKLVKKQIINKRNRKQTVYVLPGEIEQKTKQTEAEDRGIAHTRPIDEVIHTPEFKAWFGDWEADIENASKVVKAETGEPAETYHLTHNEHVTGVKVVYHGTYHGGFDEFDKGKISNNNLYGKGFYFTEDKGIAETYKKKGMYSEPVKDADAILSISREIGREVDEGVARGYIAAFEGKTAKDWLRAFDTEKQNTGLPGAPTINPQYGDLNVLSALSGQPYNIKIRDILKNHITVDTEEVKECFLKILKPFDIDKDTIDAKFIKNAYPLIQEKLKEFRESLKRQQENYEQADKGLAGERGKPEMEQNREKIIALESSLKRYGGAIKIVSDILDRVNAYTYTDYETIFSLRTEQINEIIREQGYDGLTHIGGKVTGGDAHRVWIAFEPNQIKATTASKFDPASNNIYKAGAITKLLQKARTYGKSIRHKIASTRPSGAKLQYTEL